MNSGRYVLNSSSGGMEYDTENSYGDSPVPAIPPPDRGENGTYESIGA